MSGGAPAGSPTPHARTRWDPLRLALGTLTAVPVTPPSRLDRDVAGWAMVLAPAVAVPVAAVITALGIAGSAVGVPAAALAGVLLAVLALSSRCLHLDGLADTCDGLTSSYSPQRALEVMRRGDAGPAGVAGVVLILLIQAGSLATLTVSPAGLLLAATAVIASRHALTVACRSSVPAARAEGLGGTVAGSVPRLRLLSAVTAVVVVTTGMVSAAGHPWWAGAVIVAATVLPAEVVVARARRRLGGITGDVLGAVVEVGLAGGLIAAACIVA